MSRLRLESSGTSPISPPRRVASVTLCKENKFPPAHISPTVPPPTIGKTRYASLDPETHRFLLDYLDASRHGAGPDGAPLPDGYGTAGIGAEAFDAAALSANGIYKVMCSYAAGQV